MYRFTWKYLLVLSVLSSYLSISPQSVEANPFFVGRFDGLTGGPLHQGAFALYWNPANLYSDHTEFDLFTGIIARQARYDRELPEDTPEDVAAANGGEATTSAFGAVPSLAFRTGVLVDDLRIGVGGGVYIARAGTADWDRHRDADVQYPGAYDGPQRWSALSTFMLVVNYAAGLSVGMGPLSLGAALSYSDGRLSTTKAANDDQSDDLVNQDGFLREGRIFLDDARGDVLSSTFGAYFEMAGFELGYSWRLPVIYEMEGTAHILYETAETTVTAQVELQVAESHHISAGYKLGHLRLRAEYEFQGWSLMDEQDIKNADNGRSLIKLQRRFSDTHAYRLRADYLLTHSLTLHAGISYEDGVSPEEYHEPGLSEHDQLEGGLGATFSFNESLSLHSTFFLQHFFDREVTRSAQSPSTNGNYTDNRQYLTLNLKWRI